MIYFFLIYSFLGYFFELLIFRKKQQDTLLKALGVPDLPFLTIYGFGSLILLAIKERFPTFSNFKLSLIGSLIITLFECLVGLASKKYNGYGTWNYTFCYPWCSGFVSLCASLGWFLIIYFFYQYLHPLFFLKTLDIDEKCQKITKTAKIYSHTLF